jgi:2-polyprenyl-6-methoxyphenol hydroxylase-like FAD-dependent oxidoreductase
MPQVSLIGSRAVMLMSRPPEEPRTGFLFPIEGGRWKVTLVGAGRDYPPTDDGGFLAFARSLRDPVIHDLIRDAEPLTPIRGHRRTENQRRHFERVSPWPEGLVVVGDAACAVNPVYGQGMAVAAQTARVLGEMLARKGYHPGMAREIQRQVARCNADAWLTATGEDLRYPTTEGATPDLRTRFLHRYLDRVVSAATDDERANAAFVDVLGLLRRPTSLFRPGVLASALRRGRPEAIQATSPAGPGRVLEDMT